MHSIDCIMARNVVIEADTIQEIHYQDWRNIAPALPDKPPALWMHMVTKAIGAYTYLYVLRLRV